MQARGDGYLYCIHADASINEHLNCRSYFPATVVLYSGVQVSSVGMPPVATSPPLHKSNAAHAEMSAG